MEVHGRTDVKGCTSVTVICPHCNQEITVDDVAVELTDQEVTLDVDPPTRNEGYC
uniref:Uncharacterized protein n=1 Tax=viral metagenome TaxID=1070528 RepID=A0A6M3J3J8_9ZZZZ